MTNQAMVPYEQLKTLVKADDTQARFNELLGNRTAAFLASVVSTVYNDSNLRDCDPNSVLTAAMKAAILDLPIDPNIGQAYVIGYYNNKSKKKEAQFQMGYKGYIQLALRTNTYQAINATSIYQGEQVVEDRLTGRIRLNGRRESDEVIGFLAYFRLNNGFEKFEYMSVEAIDEHAKKYSKSYGNKHSPWTTHYNEMGKKTVLKRLISKYGPLSVDTRVLQEAVEVDANGDDEMIDADFIENREAEEEQQPALPDIGITVEDQMVVDQGTGEVLEEPKNEPKAVADLIKEGRVEVIQVPADPELDKDLPDVDVNTGKVKSKQPDEMLEEIVKLGYAQTAESAAAALRGNRHKDQTREEKIEWMKGYRGWIDMGANPQQAAKEMNKTPMNAPK